MSDELLLERARAKPRPTLPLDSGDHLTRAEFERRYTARPDIEKAELVEGVVYVSSPVSVDHASVHAAAVGWLMQYAAATPGVHVADNVALRLDLENEPQPDAVLWLDESLGGKAHVARDHYMEGVPELIAEVAASSASYDMHEKLRSYRRNGVREYVVFLVHEQIVAWHALAKGDYRRQEIDDEGLLKSRVFRSLHLKVNSLWSADLTDLFEAVQVGMRSPEHARYLEQLRRSAVIG
jgi:Uma2 family endonuclease